LIGRMLSDVAAPFYYVFIWCWEKLLGASNFALRLPSFLFSIAAPLLILFAGPNDRLTRLLWAVLIALWVPSFYYATEARPYSLLYLLGTAQALLFCRLMGEPTLRRAIAWCAVSAVMVLTHYHSGLLAGLQGLAYLATWRRDALKTWPAALLFVPVAAWLAYHIPVLLQFSDPRYAWQSLLTVRDLLYLPAILIGLGTTLSMICALAIIGMLARDAMRAVRRRAFRPLPAEVIAAIASLLAILIIFGLGFISPNFTRRYVIGFAPGMLLGLAVLIRNWAGKWPLTPWVVIAFLSLTSAYDLRRWLITPDFRWNWNWQIASEDLQRAGAQRLFFLWDNPSVEILGEELLGQVGSFFFARDGVPVAAQAIRLGGQRNIDPNLVLLRHAGRPGDAIIWAYDRSVRSTLGIRHPPAIAEMDPRWQCRNYSDRSSPSQVYACFRSR
jgi:uncharacterized membrane protein